MTDNEPRSDDGDTFATEARQALDAAIDAHTCDYCGSQSDLYLHREAGVWFCNNETACEARRLQKADTVTTYESGEAFLESLDENDHTEIHISRNAKTVAEAECFTDEVLRERGLSDRLNLDPARVCDTMDEAKEYLARSPLSKGQSHGPRLCNVYTTRYDKEVTNKNGASTMVKDTAISIRFDAEHLAALDYMVKNFPAPLKQNRTGVIYIALLEMAERLEKETGLPFHENMVEAMSND